MDQRQVIVFSLAKSKVTEGTEMQEETTLIADFWS